jgi:hypothetical protein
LAGFWGKRVGVLGAAGATATFIGTVTIIPFMPDGWDASAGGFPAMTGNVPFLIKDLVLFAVSLYLLKQTWCASAAMRAIHTVPPNLVAQTDEAMELGNSCTHFAASADVSKWHTSADLPRCSDLVGFLSYCCRPSCGNAGRRACLFVTGPA